MVYVVLAGVMIASCSAALWFMPRARQIGLDHSWTDKPGARKVHLGEIPTTGGLAIVAATLVGLVVFSIAKRWIAPELGAHLLPHPEIVFGAVLIAAVGFWDDLYDLHFESKFAAQVAVSVLLVLSDYRITLFDGPLGAGYVAGFVSVVLTVFWMVGVMNAVNLLDGLDGLAAGVVAIGLVSLTAVFAFRGDASTIVLAVAVVGALLGFLKHNSAPASIFMGDSGSLFLGFVLGAYALRGVTLDHPVLNLIIPVVAIGLPILDTVTVLIRRVADGKQPFFPDQGHIHHRLARRFSTKIAVGTMYAVSIVFGAGALLMATISAVQAKIVFGVGISLVVGLLGWLGYFSPLERNVVSDSSAIDSRTADRNSNTVIPSIGERVRRVEIESVSERSDQELV